MRSFQECIDVDLTNKPYMMIQSGKKVIIAEGLTDRQVYKRVFCTEVIGMGSWNGFGGKDMVKRAVANIEMPKYQNEFRAIVDRDYDFFLGHEIESPQYVYTDAHSLETLIWKMDRGYLLDEVLKKSIPLDIVRKISDSEAFKKRVFDVVYILGIIRLVNEMNRWYVRQHFVMSECFFDVCSGDFLFDVFLKDLLEKSNKSELYNEYYQCVCDQLEQKYDKWLIMQGHDIATVFIWFVGQISDKPNEGIYDVKGFEKETRYSVYASDIRKCSLYDKVRRWENNAVRD